jgi:hypothetical protein
MCHERWMRRREQESLQAREVWLDFERTTPIADPEPDVEQPEPTKAEVPEQAVTADR